MGSIRMGMTKLIAPNLTFLPHRLVYGVKQFHLVAEPVEQTLVGGVTIRAWGYNGSTPGPVMVVHPGERVQVVFVNRLPTATSIHWHGLIVPNDVDGVPEIGAGPVIRSGETYVYDFVVRQAGTFMYPCSHHGLQTGDDGACGHDCLACSTADDPSGVCHPAPRMGGADGRRHGHGGHADGRADPSDDPDHGCAIHV
ncbi:multicopper oxidase domain-containing protein [Alicyclobacillus macrosporangiidus]|uniref:multicopper oxidase domain-containing protein n=1 Tax=Alicyclobacillus macrosporangiidus TaxID=392015 RepID=UPI00318451C7